MLTSCTGIASVEELLEPPVMSQLQEQVYNALVEAVGDDITYVYPRSGDERSAFLFLDLDSDGSDEACAFYRADEQNAVRLNVLHQTEEGWKSVYDHASPGTQVEHICTTKFSSGRNYLAIGYSSAARADKTLCIYSYTEGRLENVYSELYSRFELIDIDLDGGEDIVLVNGNTDDHPAYASLVTDSGDGVKRRSTVMMRESTAELVNTVSGGLGGGAAAVYADSASGSGTISTEILYCVDGELRDPATLDNSEIPAITSRKWHYSQDIDGDGIVEIPTIDNFPGYRDSDRIYLTNWNVFENYTLSEKYSSLFDPSRGYCFMLPTRWEGTVTVRTDQSTGERVFYKFNGTLAQSRLELMRIAVCYTREREQYEEKGYFEALTTGSESVMVLTSSDDALALTAAEVMNGLYPVKK
ncbi:MAG: hypothetical protein IJ251_03515 [Oscillospiraceae bacterium]|nr:hypothetical protein [Oscillospiraceae bacterium]